MTKAIEFLEKLQAEAYSHLKKSPEELNRKHKEIKAGKNPRRCHGRREECSLPCFPRV